ncbi:uncharacterized protein ARMOST_11264 [Armillaria ostoyae]|uniref:Uncharacterized protein n=1 Tax=Armillaria ostoyae TaxID=47428 RepID=A0A284RGN6_ARMOS|nr:uncharacterized protein ARMOST_11264 [Armillaria ostoyae]
MKRKEKTAAPVVGVGGKGATLSASVCQHALHVRTSLHAKRLAQTTDSDKNNSKFRFYQLHRLLSSYSRGTDYKNRSRTDFSSCLKEMPMI